MVAEKNSSPSAAKLIVDQLADCGIKLIVSLADSRLVELQGRLLADKRFKNVLVAREEEGVGICAGAFFGGMGAAMVMCNAGFQAAVHGIANLCQICRVPLFMVVSNRGTPGDPIFFQEYTGLLTVPIMDAMGISHYTVDTIDKIPLIADAFEYSQVMKRPVVVLLERDSLDRKTLAHYLMGPEERK